MGVTGMGIGFDFGTLAHHIPVPWVNYSRVSLIFTVLKLAFPCWFFVKFIVSHHDATRYGYASHTYMLALCSLLKFSLTPVSHKVIYSSIY